jgi:predicted ATPase
VGTYGIRGTAELLDDRFQLLWQGRRSAVPCHRTLHAMLDWSYHLLSDRDRRVLCRLSIFIGMFTHEGAQAVGVDAETDDVGVADALASLVDKSLIWTSVSEGPVLFRLLDTTRAFAAAKLASSGEGDQVARRHARHYSEKLKADAIDTAIFRGRNFSAYAPHIGNVRAAVAWSFSSRGDRAMAVQQLFTTENRRNAATLCSNPIKTHSSSVTVVRGSARRHCYGVIHHERGVSSAPRCGT